MTKTNKEIQAAYRARATKSGDKRINMFISSEAFAAFEALVERCGMNKKDLIEFLLLEELEKARIKRKT